MTSWGATLSNVLNVMNDAMLAENGMGLAANQIGYPIRIFILKKENSYEEYINPEVLSQEDLGTFEGEGCLSIPGVSAITKRYRRLRLRWQDRQGTTHEDDFENLQAFAVQHEMDHLNGKLYIDQFGPVKRQLMLSKHRKHLRELGRL
jgi:peptide deformylase